jgi:hypothetical protein
VPAGSSSNPDTGFLSRAYFRRLFVGVVFRSKIIPILRMRTLILEKGQIAAAPKWAFKRPGQVDPGQVHCNTARYRFWKASILKEAICQIVEFLNADSYAKS